MTIPKYFLKWKHNKARYEQDSDHLGKIYICSNEKVHENEHKHKKMWKKVDQFFKNKTMHTHTLICKQKEWNA